MHAKLKKPVKKINIPGPGAYNDYEMENKKSAFMAASNHLTSDEVRFKNLIGPGHYNYSSSSFNGPKISVSNHLR
jgi:hypothetical protein